jgi:hypothetical protein
VLYLVSMGGTRQAIYGVAPKSAPTPAVTVIASAPQMVTRIAPLIMLAPPANAANAPRAARKNREAAVTTGIKRVCDATIVATSGSVAPTAKLAAEDNAA